MDEKTYNGWKNYETWSAATWIEGYPGSSTYWKNQARECWQKAPTSRWVKEMNASVRDAAVVGLGLRLRNEIQVSEPLPTSDMNADAAEVESQDIDWFEIAARYVDAMAGEMAEEQEGGNEHE